MNSSKLKVSLAFISSNYSCLISTINQLEHRNLKLNIGMIQSNIEILKASKRNIYQKIVNVSDNNPGYKEINLINKILNGQQNLVD